MALKDLFTRKVSDTNVYIPSIFGSDIVDIQEKFKGTVPIIEIKFPKELGEQHPFDFKITEGLYKQFGPVTGIIDKFVDFIVGPGFFVTAEDERAQKITEDFMRDTNFDTLLRAWLKEALVKGTGFLEIGGTKDDTPTDMRVLNANSMYIVRDDSGVLKGYNQFIGNLESFKDDKV